MFEKALKTALLLLPIGAIVYGYSVKHPAKSGSAADVTPEVEAPDLGALASSLELIRSRDHGAHPTLATAKRVLHAAMVGTSHQTANFYYNASRILRFSDRIDDLELAHFYAKSALAGGEKRASKVVAETENAIHLALRHPNPAIMKISSVAVARAEEETPSTAVHRFAVPARKLHVVKMKPAIVRLDGSTTVVVSVAENDSNGRAQIATAQ